MKRATDPPISISEAARQIGINKSTLTRQLKGSAIVVDGKVRLTDVLAFRAEHIDLTRSGRRAGAIDNLDPLDADAPPAAPDAPIADDDVVIVEGAPMPYPVARALRESYVARLRQLEFEVKSGEVAPVAAMQAFLESALGVVRERLLAIPGKLAGDFDPHQIERLTAEIFEAMRELSDPSSILDDLAGPDRDSDDHVAAAPALEFDSLGRAVPACRGKDKRRTGPVAH